MKWIGKLCKGKGEIGVGGMESAGIIPVCLKISGEYLLSVNDIYVHV